MATDTSPRSPPVTGAHPVGDAGAVAPAKNIMWLASYPKSGNTWFRVFLTNLLGRRQETADINDLDAIHIASARGAFDQAVGLEAGDLTGDEIDRLRPRVYDRWSAASPDETLFRKIHDAYEYTPGGEPLVSAAATRGAIYLVRNPLDVAVSYAHHSATTLDDAVTALCDPDHAFCGNPRSLANQLRQRLSTWSGHVRSWTRQRDVPVHVVRYEDMKRRPIETFAGAVSFAGVDCDTPAIARAVELSAFERLREQEAADGFREKARNAGWFFRRGEVGAWRDTLSPGQVSRILECHGEVMSELGYLTDGRLDEACAPSAPERPRPDSP